MVSGLPGCCLFSPTAGPSGIASARGLTLRSRLDPALGSASLSRPQSPASSSRVRAAGAGPTQLVR